MYNPLEDCFEQHQCLEIFELLALFSLQIKVWLDLQEIVSLRSNLSHKTDKPPSITVELVSAAAIVCKPQKRVYIGPISNRVAEIGAAGERLIKQAKTSGLSRHGDAVVSVCPEAFGKSSFGWYYIALGK